MPDPLERNHARKRVEMGHLPRLDQGYYVGRSFIHWTFGIEGRDTSWLTPHFHQEWRLSLLHTCGRFRLACAAYVLMPDHIHLLTLGLTDDANQRSAVSFLRRHLHAALSPARWQHQPYDHVLTALERARDAFQAVASYILQNPVRAGLVTRAADYPYLGNCVPGYPDLDQVCQDYWERFWRIYYRLAEPNFGSTRSRA